MHVGKAIGGLEKLAGAQGTLGTFATATVLLDGLEKANEGADVGTWINSISREKIGDARGWFEILCGIGEDGNWPEDSIRDSIRKALLAIKGQLKEESQRQCFKDWPLS